MFTRLTHAAFAFAIVVVAYQVYVVVAAPFIEPSAAAQQVEQSDSSQSKHPQAVHKHRELLAAYFPADHWALQKPPKTIVSDETMIVLDDYQPRDNGQVRVNRCAILFFPQGRVRGQVPPRDAVVIEVPSGAVFQMDDTLSPGPGGMGRIQWGKLLGQIVVRSDMREPGPQDDLHVVTRDLQLEKDFIRTDAKVQMRLGPHRASGRVMEMRLVANERAGAGQSSIGGLDSIDILHEVHVELAVGNARLFDDSSQPQAPPAATPAAPPIEIRSLGPFRFDFSSYVAAFEKKVRATQLHPTGESDQLTCDMLSLYFARKEDLASSVDAAVDSIVPTPTETHGMVALQPAVIEAKGTVGVPVVLNAPSQPAAARCDRMRIELDARRITFDGPSEVSLKLGNREIHAPMIRYQHPPAGSPYRLGTMSAAGAGWLKAVANDKRPDQLLEVRWSQEMLLQHEEGQSVLSIFGRPRMEMVGLGRLRADQLHVYLYERAEGQDAHLPFDIVPDRVWANGHVSIESAELSCRVNQLTAWINYASNELVMARPDGDNSPQLLRGLGRQRAAQRKAYEIEGDTLRLQLTVRDSKPDVSDISVDGDVDFREAAVAHEKSQPLKILASSLRVKSADTPSAEITIHGWPHSGTAPTRPAQIQVGDMKLRARLLRLNRGGSWARIDSPGEMEMTIARDLNGKLLAQPQPMTISWQQGGELNQDRFTFRGGVLVRTIGGILRTERLVAVLSEPVRFDGSARSTRPELAQIECREGVVVDFTERDARGPTSMQHFELESIIVNQQTGNVSGDGPGFLESIRLTNGTDTLAMLGGNNGNRSATASAQSMQRLRYMKVEFTRSLSGNFQHDRQIEVVGGVEAIYGPVDSWQLKLQRNVRQGPGPNTFWIDSNRLGVAESPLARLDRSKQMGPLELFATGRVTIEGSTPKGGTFTARGQRANYDQLKTSFTLEGDAHAPATFVLEDYVGAPRSPSSARKFTYNQTTGAFQAIDARLQYNHIQLGRPTAAPGRSTNR